MAMFEGLLPLRSALICIGLLLSHTMAQGSGISQSYCSNQNTGSSYGPIYDQYQSMGSCSESCRFGFAFAILQGPNCWCSNYIPAQQDSTSDCTGSCPGYGSDLCGNPAQGLFGYIALDRKPSGTAGAPSPAQSTQAPQSSSPDPKPSVVSTTIYQTRTSVTTTTPKEVTSYVTPSPPSSSVAPQSSSVPPSSSSPSRTPVVRTSVITRSGSIVTQTVTTTPIVVPGNDSPVTTSMHRGLSGGAIAGIVIGVLVGLAALAFAAFLLWRRKKGTDDENTTGSTRPKRTTSVLSRTGLLGGPRPVSMAEQHPENEPYNSNLRNSHLFVGAGASIEPSSPLDSRGSQDYISSSSRRPSRPMVYDQRLNPSALFMNAEGNGSRVSMQDQQDYSRPLGIANPDFRPSFDSR